MHTCEGVAPPAGSSIRQRKQRSVQPVPPSRARRLTARRHNHLFRRQVQTAAGGSGSAPPSDPVQLTPLTGAGRAKQEGPSANIKVIWSRLWKVLRHCLCPSLMRHQDARRSCLSWQHQPVEQQPSTCQRNFCAALQLALPYWTDPEQKGRARWRLAAVVALTVGTTGVR